MVSNLPSARRTLRTGMAGNTCQAPNKTNTAPAHEAFGRKCEHEIDPGRPSPGGGALTARKDHGLLAPRPKSGHAGRAYNFTPNNFSSQGFPEKGARAPRGTGKVPRCAWRVRSDLRVGNPREQGNHVDDQ